MPPPSSITGTDREASREGRAPLRAWLATPTAMVLVALLLRVAALTVGHTYRFNPVSDNFGFGWESGRIARALAAGEGFSSPFHGNTGPTAWVAPLYPYLIAGVFKLFGVYSRGSAWILLALNSLFSALTCWSMYRLADETVGRRVARWAGWTWALLPYAVYWAIRWVWETNFSALLLSLALLITLRIERKPRLVTWLLLGAIWGVIALANPSCLSLLPFSAAWLAWRCGRQRRAWLGGGLAAAAVCLALVAPWTIRNYRVFGSLVPIRSNFGVELRLGNSPSAQGLWMSWFHPSQDPREFARYRQMGELAYGRARRQEAMDFIRENPGRFAELCLRRALWFWIGTPRSSTIDPSSALRNSLFLLSSVLAFWGLVLVIRDRQRGAWLYALALLVYPAVYYLTFAHPRYRHPIEPEMVILGLYLLATTLPEPAPRSDA